MRRRIVRGLRLALAVGAAWVASPRVGAAQVAVDALEIALPLHRKDRTPSTQTITVTNGGEVGTQVNISAADWDRSETGENRYAPLGTMKQSCGAKVSVFPSVLYLAPKESATIRVRLDSAAVGDEGCYTILFVEAPKPRNTDTPTGIRYSVRYGVKVYVEPDVAPSAEIIDADALPPVGPRGDSVAVSVLFSNTGARQTLVHGVAEIRRLDNSVVQSVPIAEFPTLPSAKRRLIVGLPRLPRGSYVVLVMLDFGGPEVAAAQIAVDVP